MLKFGSFDPPGCTTLSAPTLLWWFVKKDPKPRGPTEEALLDGCFSAVKTSMDRNLLATSNMQVECVDKARRDFLLVSSGGDL